MAFTKAERVKVPLKIGLFGPSGSGKSYSALRMAKGMIEGTDKKIYYIDTEGGRGKYYADEFDYQYTELEAPFTPERYIALINEVVKQPDAGVLIIDGISQEWVGTGGLLQAHDNIPGNSYTAWKTITPRHTKFLESILSAPVHTIATARAKEEFVLEDDNGKKVPKKVGMGAITRDGFSYEMTITFIINQNNHFGLIDKDNSHLFDNFCEQLTEKHGKMLVEWASGAHCHTDGAVVPQKAIKEPKSTPTTSKKEEKKPEKPVKKEVEKKEPEVKKEEILPPEEITYFDDFTYIKEAEEKYDLLKGDNKKKYFQIMTDQKLTPVQMRAIVKNEDIQKAGITGDQLHEIRAGLIFDFESKVATEATDNSAIVEETFLAD
jgi:hypothetical protein